MSECRYCGGNDKDAPCAYPSENKHGCLRDERLSGFTDLLCVEAISMSYPAFKEMKLWTKVRATQDITTKNRTMKAGETGVIIERWAYTVGVRPDGKKLTVTTYHESDLEIIHT